MPKGPPVVQKNVRVINWPVVILDFLVSGSTNGALTSVMAAIGVDWVSCSDMGSSSWSRGPVLRMLCRLKTR